MAEWVKLRAAQYTYSLGMTRPAMPHAVAYRRVLCHAINIQELGSDYIGNQFWS